MSKKEENNGNELDLCKEFMSLHDDLDDSVSNDKSNKETVSDENLDPDMAIIKSAKKSKKDKKKKKKYNDDKLDLLMEDISIDDELRTSDNIMIDDDDDYLIFKKTKKGRKKDLFDIKQAKKKRKRDLEAKFAPQLTELRRILKDSDEAAGMIKEVLGEIRGSKSRYVGKTLTDLFQALNSANSNRASVVRDISNIHKTIVDLNIKRDKSKPDNKKTEDMDNEEYGINIFQRLLGNGGGRKGLMNDAKEYFSGSDAENDPTSEMIGDNIDELNDEINQRLNDEGNDMRSDNGNKYIEYENDGAQDCILLHKDGTWEPDAIDKYRQRMTDDYPRLTSEDLGDIHIDKDSMIASDRYGRKFPVIEVP